MGTRPPLSASRYCCYSVHMHFPLRLHALFWVLVAALDLALNRASHPGDEFGWALYGTLSLCVVGFALTTALRPLYRAYLAETGIKTVLQILVGTVGTTIVWYLLLHWLGQRVGYPYAEPLVQGLFGKGMLCTFVIVAWHSVLLSLRSSARATEANQLAKEATLAALRHQLNPHFLFNALNSAIALIDEDSERAQTMLTRLSHLLRKTLEGDTSSMAPLARELEFIEHYIEIESVRFEDKLKVDYDIEESSKAFLLPPLLLHTLVENAVKHGFRNMNSKSLQIQISTRFDNHVLSLTVSNTGRIPSRGDGIGLENLKKRLQAAYPEHHKFDLSEADGRVIARIEIDSPRRSA